jgi:CRISPR-associated protein Csm2
MNGQHNSRRFEESSPAFLDEMKLKMPDWITKGITKDTVTYAEQLGRYLNKQDYSSSQIRNIFGEIKRLEMQGWSKTTETSLLLFKPKLAYGAARQSMKAASNLTEILKTGIDSIIDSEENNKEAALKNFSQIFEAVLAYHKAFGGK